MKDTKKSAVEFYAERLLCQRPTAERTAAAIAYFLGHAIAGTVPDPEWRRDAAKGGS